MKGNKIMNFNEFRNSICEMLKAKLDDTYELTNHDVLKVNRSFVGGILVKRSQSKICPVLYLEEAYKEYQEDESRLELIAESLFELIEDMVLPETMDFTLEALSNWEKAKLLVQARVINTEQNKEFLDTVPHRTIENLSIVYYLSIENEDSSSGVVIGYQLLERYEKTEEDIYQQAIENMSQEEIVFKGIGEIMGLISPDEFFEEDPIGMYVLTNHNHLYGAGLILAKWVREMIFSFCGGSCYLLPASQHEWIVLKKILANEGPHLCELVKEVNSTAVSVEDFLADNVYMIDNNRDLKLVA